jgi:hypothetical protein
MTIEQALGRYLRLECLELSDLVSARIYHGQPPANATFPLLVFRKASELYIAETLTNQGELIRAGFEIMAISEVSQEQAASIAAAVKLCLSGAQGRMPSTDGEWSVSRPIRRTNEEDVANDRFVEQGLFAVAQSYEVVARPFTV